MLPRRTFFSTLLSTLAGLIFFWRKPAAAAAPLPPKDPFFQPRIDSHECTLEPVPVLYADIMEMMSDITAHTMKTGDNVKSADLPASLLFGFVAMGSDGQVVKHWAISMVKLRDSLKAALATKPTEPHAWGSAPVPVHVKAQVFESYMKTSEGRARLARGFPGQRQNNPTSSPFVASSDLKGFEPV